jgi:hypothetical protein
MIYETHSNYFEVVAMLWLNINFLKHKCLNPNLMFEGYEQDWCTMFSMASPTLSLPSGCKVIIKWFYLNK